MIAKDGILLASDMLTVTTNLPGRPAASFYAEKILIVEDKGLAYCCAGDDLALALGEEIRTTINAEAYRNPRAFFLECCLRIIERNDSRVSPMPS